jgi:3-hydroxymyristoyl/3-hydroxydecanoyl-(acyl carrier protein) dehydratase
VERLSILVDGESPLFAGHFPGDPILPGVGLLGFAVEALESWERRPVTLLGLRDFRLRRVVRPGDALEVHFSRTAKPGEIRFAVKCGPALTSSGLLITAPPPPTST